MEEKITLKIKKHWLSTLKKRNLRSKKSIEAYFQKILERELSMTKINELIEKLTVGYPLGGFNRSEIYDRH